MEGLVVLVVGALLVTPILVLVVLGRVGRMRDEVERLDGSVKKLGDRVDRIGWRVERAALGEPAPPAPPAPPRAAGQPREEQPARGPRPSEAKGGVEAAEPPPQPPVEAPPVPVVVEGPRPEPAPRPSLRPVEVPEPAVRVPPPLPRIVEKARPALGAQTLESAIGQRWLVRIGALVLVVGAGFLYAYAIDRGWITKPQRAISGAIVGLAVVGLGVFFNRRGFAPLAQGFVGCGAGLLFLDIFAAHRLYDLIGAQVALPAMAAVAVLVAVIAIRWSAMPLIILAQIGAFLAPFLVLEPSWNREVVVFLHLFVADAGFLVVGALKRWRPVEIVAAAGTPIVFTIAVQGVSSLTPLEGGWAVAFDALFLLMAAVPAFLRRERLDEIGSTIVAGMAVLAAAVAESGIGPSSTVTLALALGGLAFLHAALGEGLAARIAGTGSGAELLRLVGGLLALDAVRFPFGREGTTAAYVIAGCALALLGRQRNSVGYRAAAAAAFVLVIARILDRHLHGAAHAAVQATAFWNVDFALALAGAAGLAAASFTWKEARWIGLSAAGLFGALVLSGEVAFWISGSVSDPRYAEALVAASRAVVLSGLVVGFAAAARRTGRWQFLAIDVVMVLLALLQFQRLIEALQTPPQWLVLNPVCLASLLVPLSLLAIAWLLRGDERFHAQISLGLALLGAALPLATLSVEAYRFFHERFPQINALVDAGSAAVSVTWAIYAGALLAIGISKRLRAARLGALGLLAATLIKVVLSDLANLDQLARIASFIALGIVLMAGAWAYHRFAARIFGETGAAKPGA
jgi:uncharacterized membrane protein